MKYLLAYLLMAVGCVVAVADPIFLLIAIFTDLVHIPGLLVFPIFMVVGFAGMFVLSAGSAMLKATPRRDG